MDQLLFGSTISPALSPAQRLRENFITAGYVGTVLLVNAVLATMAIPGGELVAGILSPFVNLLLGGAGIALLFCVWPRSSERVFVLHAVVSIALPYAGNWAVWKVACLAAVH